MSCLRNSCAITWYVPGAFCSIIASTSGTMSFPVHSFTRSMSASVQSTVPGRPELQSPDVSDGSLVFGSSQPGKIWYGRVKYGMFSSR